MNLIYGLGTLTRYFFYIGNSVFLPEWHPSVTEQSDGPKDTVASSFFIADFYRKNIRMLYMKEMIKAYLTHNNVVI